MVRTETLTKYSLCSTPRGISFTAPPEWTLKTTSRACILQAPEDDIKLALVDVVAENADQAVTEAWPVLATDFKRILVNCQSLPARDGWDEVKNYGYEVSVNERMTISAMALRKEKTWTVVLFFGSDAAFERRKAEVRVVTGGVRPPGFTRELFLGKSANIFDEQRKKQLSDFIQRAMQLCGIPGVALTLVQKDGIIFESGFGVRELGKNEVVDANTLFLIASNTKQLTTLLLAKLVDQKKFSWDTPVTAVFPEFKLGDPETSKKVQRGRGFL